MAQAWSKQNRKAGLTRVVPLPTQPSEDSQGDEPQQLSPPVQTAHHLRQYWQGIFAQKRTVQLAQDELLRHAPEVLPDQRWDISMEMLRRKLCHPKASSPGPDGLPYRASAAVADQLAPIVHILMQRISTNHHDIPLDLNMLS